MHAASLFAVDTQRPLIAIVDDEESVRRAISRLIVSAGFRARAFAGGSTFLSSLQTERPDCVVLDLHMPEMNGFEVQEQLRKFPHPVPVVVITGHHTAEARQRALEAGAVDYLRKPVDDEALLGVVSRALAQV